jgi:GT2 family glycosyltransferase
VLRARRDGITLLHVPGIVVTHNDCAGSTVADYCQRQRIHCQSAALLEERFGAGNPRSDVVRRNSPPAFGSKPLTTTAAKLVKAAVSTEAVSRPFFALTAALERVEVARPLPPCTAR